MSHALPFPVNPIDENHLLYGNFIGLQYVFDEALNAETLAAAIKVLVAQFPALSGRYNPKKGWVEKVINGGVTLAAHQSDLEISDFTPARQNYISEPPRRDVLRGKAPLATFTHTEFRGGGSVFGMAISHLLTDAAGYQMLAKHLGEIYTELAAGRTAPEFHFATQLPVFQMGTTRSKRETLKALQARGLPKPIPIKGVVGRLVKNLIIKAMDKSLRENPPIVLHFAPEHIANLKQTVLQESGEGWISTNAALCAHFCGIAAQLSYGETLQTEMQIGQLLDLRNRYFAADSEQQMHFVGNAILIHIEKANFPDGLQNTPRGQLARYFKARQSRTNADDVKTRLNLLADSLRHGYTNPELDVKNPIISLNNQSKMPVYAAQFSGQHPARIIPQDVGDNIMFFPAADDGVEVYIRDIVNPGRQSELLEPNWQERIFDV